MSCLSFMPMLLRFKLHGACRMIAGFGSGAAFSLVSGMTQGNPLMGAFSTGTLFALLQGAFYQVLVCIESGFSLNRSHSKLLLGLS